MKTISPDILAPRLLSAVTVSVLVAGCGGGSTPPSYQPPGMSQSIRAQSCQGHRTFHYIGYAQHFRVPKCATAIYIDAKGASGKYGGDGGEVSATIPVTRGEKLIVTVGGAGRNFKGGFNGGAAGAIEIIRRGRYKGRYPGAGGGGASDVRQGGSTLTDRVVVAGGGGGQDQNGDLGTAGTGGTGGGLPHGGSGGTPDCNLYGSGPPVGGGGGRQSSGGTGGAGGNSGSLGSGGAGVGVCFARNFPSQVYAYFSTGGGGGYYGGGGGANGGSGGGGSGYAEPTANNVSSQNGVNSGNGSVLICWGYSNEMCGTH